MQATTDVLMITALILTCKLKHINTIIMARHAVVITKL